jgi:hypothetical protein
MKRIRLNDKVKTHDRLCGGFRGEIIFGKNKFTKEYIDPFGNKATRLEFEEVTYRGENIVPITGYHWVFRKMFNLPISSSKLIIGNLNDEAPMMKIGVPSGSATSSMNNFRAEIASNPAGDIDPHRVNFGINVSALDHVFGFMIGDGGAKEDNITVLAPDYKRRTLFRAVPFRMVPAGDLPRNFQLGKYYGKTNTFSASTDSMMDSYYIKKFDNPPPKIVHIWADESIDWLTESITDDMIIDDHVFASTSTIPIESYVEISMSISAIDTREFFISTNSLPRINEFGLVSGWFNHQKDDYEALTLITHFTRNTLALADGDSIEAIYRLYAR